MKIYCLPKELPAPEVVYSNYNHALELQKEKSHQEKLELHLKKIGFNGPLTGKVYKTPMGDGYACYMFADATASPYQRRSGLVHLPYGDGYNDPNVQYIPKKEIVARMEADEKLAKHFHFAKK